MTDHWLFTTIVNHWLFWVCLAAVGFGYPLITRTTGASPANVAFYVIVSAVPVVTIHKLMAATDQLTGNARLTLIVAGVLLGLGMVAYSKVFSTPAWPLSITLPASGALFAAVMVIGGLLIFKESLTPQQWVGLGLTGGGIWLLS